MLPLAFRVRRVQRETADVFTLHIAREDGALVPSFEPGQFNMLYAFGVGEVPISIAGASRGMVVHTIRAIGPVTVAMAGWKRGAALGVRGPYGSAWPLTEAQGKDVLMIAGGIGLAPLWSALGHVLKHRARYRHVSLLYGTRIPADRLYRAELDRLAEREDVHVDITVDRAGMEWCGNVGLVTALINRAPFDPANTLAMMCGPEVMMRFGVRELQRRGMRDSRIFLSMERNMKCAIGLCGHCQFGPEFICKDGAVFAYDRVARWLNIPEL
jgi:NAD(P)H-flavin reductase